MTRSDGAPRPVPERGVGSAPERTVEDGEVSAPGGSRWCGMAAGVLAIALTASAAKPEAAKGKAQAKAAKAKEKAKEKEAEATPAAELQKIAEAARKEVEAGATSSGIKLPARPHRAVARPTLTAAGLDALVDKFLASAKVAAGRADDRRRVRPPDLPRPDRQAARRPSRSAPSSTTAREGQAGQADRAPARTARTTPRNWARYWRDVIKFRATNAERRPGRLRELEDWLAEQLARNRPWDEIATEHDHRHRPRTTRTAPVDFALAHEAQAGRDGGRGLADLPGRADPVRPVPRPPDRLVEAAAVPRVRRLLRRDPGAAGSQGRGGQPPVFEVVAAGQARATRCPT